MNYSEWKVTSNLIGGEKMYAAYRIRDINEVDHSGNREYAGEWTSNREAAQIVAEQLNHCNKDQGRENKPVNNENILKEISEKEILRQQLKLLAERSRNCLDEELCNMSNIMLKIAYYLSTGCECI